MNIQGLLGLVTFPKYRQKLGDTPTPLIIVKKLVDSLEEDPIELMRKGEILYDPCCGHGGILLYIASKAKSVLDPLYIAKHLKGNDIKHGNTAKKLLANELGIDPKYINVSSSDSLTMKSNIKNFRVIMNPPFNEKPGEKRNDAGNSNNTILYQSFIEKFTKDAKQVISLNPAGWTIKEDEVKKLKQLGLKSVEFLSGKHFPTVSIRSGLTINNFVKDYDSDLTIKTEDEVVYSQPRDQAIKNIKKETFDILKMVKEHKTLDKVILRGSISLPKGTKSSVKRASELDPINLNITQTDVFNFKTLAYINDGKKMSYVFSKNKCTHFSKFKIAISSATQKYELGHVVIVPPNQGICRNNFIIPLENQKQCDLYKMYLDSDFIKFIIKNVKFNDVVNTNNNSWSYIPAIPIEDLEVCANELNEKFNINDFIKTYFKLSDNDLKLIGPN